ncbi:hypothetical protein BDQ17DRAFT_1333632 [Cyathus striatus]|nr:hypothetical protein BDQ17DRAFT_1333632 [Cyathus striatus]
MYTLENPSALTLETGTSYLHPMWAEKIKEEQETNRNSLMAVKWDIIQLVRDNTISLHFWQAAPRPIPKRHKLQIGAAETRDLKNKALRTVMRSEENAKRKIGQRTRKPVGNHLPPKS